MGGGRLDIGDITALTRWFLGSDGVVRLVNPDPSGRAPGQWSTVKHRRLEDRVLHNLVALQQRPAVGIEPATVAAALGGASHLGADQTEAVEQLCAAGPALRALISPAGYGKTTTLAAATDAARRAGRPVLAVSTTNQAVDQLRQAGIDAMTVARFARSGAQLAPGNVVVVDEFSQLPTREAHTLLEAAAGCEGALVWMVGDPLQAQPVGAGGLAPWIAEEAGHGRLPVAELSVNRRQADPVERQALGYFRAAEITHSQDLRDQAGWEHHHRDRERALAAMTAAVLSDIEIHGAGRVTALAVSHADCETLADRIRADLADQGALTGPCLEGPGWTGPREYQTGDRILLHAHLDLSDGRRLTNGTVATVTAVSPAGLTVITDTQPQPVLLGAEFVTGRTLDGRPQLSQAWARTIDGVQGGTWDQVHLLATPALDRYRGYVGQSRSICPTHTWNTTPQPSDDHGGKLVETYSTPAEQIAAALARAQPKTFAADHDPYRHEANVRAEQKAHQTQLARRPPDVTDDLNHAEQTIQARQHNLDDARDRLAHWQAEYEHTSGGLRTLTRAGRDQHRAAGRQVEYQAGTVERETERLEQAESRRDDLFRQHAAGQALDRSNQWQAQRIKDLDIHLNRYWAQAVLDAAQDGHPATYGKARLQAAYSTLIEQIEHLAERPGHPKEEGARPIADPLVALRDLDQAIKQAVEEPALRLVEPARPHRHQTISPPGLDIHQQHQAYQQLHQPGPSIGVEL